MKKTHRRQQSGLSEEVLAVLECSPNLELCEEFFEADICRFADHLKEGSASNASHGFRQTDKNLKR
jgi:hypothetical protein